MNPLPIATHRITRLDPRSLRAGLSGFDLPTALEAFSSPGMKRPRRSRGAQRLDPVLAHLQGGHAAHWRLSLNFVIDSEA